METKPFKTCSKCGRRMTAAQWNLLPLCGSGYQAQYTEEGDIHPTLRLELRNCGCGSTLCVEVARG